MYSTLISKREKVANARLFPHPTTGTSQQIYQETAQKDVYVQHKPLIRKFLEKAEKSLSRVGNMWIILPANQEGRRLPGRRFPTEGCSQTQPETEAKSGYRYILICVLVCSRVPVILVKVLGNLYFIFQQQGSFKTF
jgi:hypothetical protein